MISGFSLQNFRFHLEPKGPLQMPACLRATHRQAFNKGSTLRPRPEARPEGFDRELSRTAHPEGQSDMERVWEYEGVVRFDSKTQRR